MQKNRDLPYVRFSTRCKFRKAQERAILMKKATTVVSALVLGMAASSAAFAGETTIPMNSTVSTQNNDQLSLGVLQDIPEEAIIGGLGALAFIAIVANDDDTTTTTTTSQ